MTAAWDEKAVFLKAIALAGEDRERYLREACPNEEAIERISRLIRAHEDATRAPDATVATSATPLEAEPQPASFDEFRVIRRIGAGGMGVVYLARDDVLDRTVALKVLSQRLTDSAKARARFADEAKLTASLRHPAIVTVYKFGEVGESCYIASEYVEGPTFEQAINEHAERLGRAGHAHERRAWRREAAEACAAVAEALQAAHAARIVHRDVKPSNILLDQRAGARLTDFGIARRLTEADLGQQTAVVGSCHYMSPEQASVEAARVDERSDVFSLGVTLYEAIALRKPFDGDTVLDVLRAIQSADAARLRTFDKSIDRDLETICHKAIEKRPVDRYQTAAHMAADLRCWLRGDPILARPPSLARRSKRFLRRHRRPALVAAALLLIAATAWIIRLGESTRASLAFLREAASAPVGSLSTPSLAQIVVRGNGLLVGRGDLPPDVDQVRAGVNDLLRERIDDARAVLAEIDASLGRVEESVRRARFADFERIAGDLGDVCIQESAVTPFIDDAIIAATRDIASQTRGGVVTVDPAFLEGPARDYRVVVLSLMQHPGSPVEAASSDASASIEVASGYYRIAVHDPSGRVREYTRSIRLRERIMLEPDWSRPVATERMARIEGATLTWPAVVAGEPHPYAGASVVVAPFLIDRYEVSNRDYRAYFDTLDRTEKERRRPALWSVHGYPHGRAGGRYAEHPWDDLPVVGVTWFSANEYAAWAGKRLPTYAEWTLAAAGRQWRRYPFAGEWDEDDLPANIYAPSTAPYAESVLAVRTMPSGATPEGVHHMFGNVHEWTESIGFYLDDSGLEKASDNVRMLCGGAWNAVAQGDAALIPHRFDADRLAASEFVGFRCALSLGGEDGVTNTTGAQ